MADTKITGLQPPQAGYSIVPSTDVLPIVVVADPGMAASGSTRKATVNQILGAGGTATLASATITGDLTVDTSTLKVDSANDRVGIGTVSPTSKLHILNTAAATRITITDDSSNGRSGYIESNYSDALVIGTTSGVRAIRFSPDNKICHLIEPSGTFTWYDGAGGTRMTLNSTGLGVGVGPGYKLDVRTAPATAAIEGSRISDATRTMISGQTGATYSYLGIGANQNVIYTSAARLDIVADSQSLFLRTGTASYLNLDSSGNVGVGVTPSAWSAYKALQINTLSSLSASSGSTDIALNWRFDSSNKYIANGFASSYTQFNGSHIFNIAGNNTLGAGAALTWTPAMTLDASGNLLVGTTSALNSVAGSYQVAIGGSGIQTLSQAISAATATTICRSGSGGMAVVAGYNGTGQYSAIIIFSYGAGGSVTVVSSQNNTGSTITYALSGVNVQVTSSLALTNLTTTCIRTA